MAEPTADPAPQPPVVVKKYANRRLYNTETSSYITLDNLAEMIRHGRDFVVYDAKSGEDITRGVLTQIIVEEESKGTSMLPTPFLRQLIGFYGDSLQGVVPRYLETAMSSFARQQQQLREVVQQTFGPFIPASVEEMSRQNMAVIERTMSMFNPFHRGSTPLPPAPPAMDPPGDAPAAGAPAAGAPAADAPALAPELAHEAAHEASVQAALAQQAQAEVERLQHEVDALRAQLAEAHAQAAATHAPPSALDAPTMRADPPAALAAQPGRRGPRRRLTQD